MQKSVILIRASICHYGIEMDNTDILVLTNVSEGQIFRLTRLAKGLRQIDVASKANVQPIDITAAPLQRYESEIAEWQNQLKRRQEERYLIMKRRLDGFNHKTRKNSA